MKFSPNIEKASGGTQSSPVQNTLTLAVVHNKMYTMQQWLIYNLYVTTDFFPSNFILQLITQCIVDIINLASIFCQCFLPKYTGYYLRFRYILCTNKDIVPKYLNIRKAIKNSTSKLPNNLQP